MNWLKITLLAGFFSIGLPTFGHGTEETSFEETTKKYLKECGGKIYSNCNDDDKLSQKTLFDSAVALALTSGKKVFVIFGYDRCPACQQLKRSLDSHKEVREKIEKSFVMVEINGLISSGTKVGAELNVNLAGFPSAIIYDPMTKTNTSEIFLPTSVEIENLPGLLERNGKAETTNGRPGYIGNVRTSLLDSPVKLAQPGFGTSRFVPSTQLTGEAREQLIRQAQSGMLYLHGFWWIEAIRAFNSALELESANPILQALMALAVKEIENTDENEWSLKLIKQAKSSSFPLDQDDRAMIQAIYYRVCKERLDGCKDNEVIKTDYFSLIKKVTEPYKFTKPDYLAWIGYQTDNIPLVQESLVKDPGNVGARHYLTHLFEANGKADLSAREAQIHALIAPKSPHAQHMYGHILPQQGHWPEATNQFKRAHQLQKAEFAGGLHELSEDWHFGHNIDLYVGTLVYQNRFEEAAQLLKDGCDGPSNGISCQTKIAVLVAKGDYNLADEFLTHQYGRYRSSPYLFLQNLMVALGKKNLAEAERLVKDNETKVDLDDKYQIYGKIAIQALLRHADVTEIERSLSTAKAGLQASGFDSWSRGVLYSRMLTRVLQDNGRQDLVDKLLAVTVGSGGPGTCHGAAICTPKK